MRFLKGMMKTPDETQDEDQDEFNAEENGLLMAQPPAGDKKEAAPRATPEADAPQAAVSEAEEEMANQPAKPTENEATQSPDGEGEPPTLIDESSPAPSPEQETAIEAAPEEQSSSDNPLDFFKAAATRETLLPALKDDLEEVSAADLLAEARSTLNCLLGGQAAGDKGPRDEQAA